MILYMFCIFCMFLYVFGFSSVLEPNTVFLQFYLKLCSSVIGEIDAD